MATKAKRMGQSATAHSLTVSELRERLKTARRAEFAALERAFSSDSRKGVQSALEAARKRLEAEDAERQRLDSLYAYQDELCREKGAQLCMGLDEAGRGPLAGPLAVAGTVLPGDHPIPFLNDSKQVPPERREELAHEIKRVALAWDICFIPAEEIDLHGMGSCLARAFREVIGRIDAQLPGIGLVLLDGNAQHLDPREANVVKGDARCASIAAASILAKTERDAYMDAMAELYPLYGFESNKGYGTALHTQAIEEHGLCPLHRRSFCTSFLQERLF